MIEKILIFFKNRKILFLILIILFGSYFGYTRIFKKEENKFLVDFIKRGDLEIKVSGTGKIEPIEEFNLKAKVSGEIVYLGVKEGDYVNKGTLIAKIDSKNIEKAIEDQEISIKNLKLSIDKAKLDLQKLNSQYEDLLRGDDYQKALNQGKEILNNFYNFYPGFIEDLRKIYFEKDFDNFDNNLKYYEGYNSSFKGKNEELERKYNQIKNKYIELSNKFKNLNEQDKNSLENRIKETYGLILETYDLVNEGKEIVRYVKEILILQNSTHEKQNIIENHFQKLINYLTTLGQYKQNLFEVISKINSYKDTLKNYDFDKNNLELLIKQKEIELEQAEKKLKDLKDDLEDYYVYSPFEGTISQLNVKLGDLTVNNQIIGTLITNQKIAKISLNEIDIAKVKIGQKAKLTFDAYPDLVLYGKVIEISPTGKEEQGVISYDVKIAFENYKGIKPGMTVNAEITIDRKENVILVPNSAIKTDKDKKYIEIYKGELKNIKASVILKPELIEKRYVETGAFNDEFTEIKNGAKEGEIIIVKSLNQKVTQKQQSNPFLPRMPFGQRKQ